jgi:hypothetical protein
MKPLINEEKMDVAIFLEDISKKILEFNFKIADPLCLKFISSFVNLIATLQVSMISSLIKQGAVEGCELEAFLEVIDDIYIKTRNVYITHLGKKNENR